MKGVKTKSSGWRPAERRAPWNERSASRAARRTATARHDCDRLGLWRACPVRRCRRMAACSGEPSRCLKRSATATAAAARNDAASRLTAPALAAAPTDATAAARPAVAPALSAAAAAAAIAASIAALPSAPPDGDDLVAVVRDGRVHYLPRQR